MTIEEEFFKTFGIEPKWKDKRVKNAKTYYTEEQAEYLRRTTKNRNIRLCYPEITDRILLELICILNKYRIAIYGLGERYNSSNLDRLKNEILDNCYAYAKYFKAQEQEKRLNDFKCKVRSLFEVEE